MAVQRNASLNDIEFDEESTVPSKDISPDTHKHTSGLVLAPSSNVINRQTAKWMSFLPNEDDPKAKEEERGSRRNSSLRTRNLKFWYKNQKLQSYYDKLEKDEATIKEAEEITKGSTEAGETEGSDRRKKLCVQLSVDTAARLTLSVNFLLFFLKLAAAIQSGSLAVLSSLIDSTLDLLSGFVIAVTSYLMRHYDPFHYPIGRTRLEPVAITITAAIMGTATLQVITTSVEEIATGSANPNINFFSGTIIVLTIILKGILFLLCIQVDSASVKALATDHRNDVASNIATLIFGLLGTYVVKVLDPIGALLLSVYIIFNWVLVAREQMINLIGHRADRRFISKITYVAKEHDERILKVDTVQAYTFGINYLVEVHIVLSPEMRLEESHDIGESLQLKLESLKEVERAFVHCDFEFNHSPKMEHILPTS